MYKRHRFITEIKAIGFDYDIQTKDIENILNTITREQLDKFWDDIKHLVQWEHIITYNEDQELWWTEERYSESIKFNNKTLFLDYSGDAYSYDELEHFVEFCIVDLLHQYVELIWKENNNVK